MWTILAKLECKLLGHNPYNVGFEGWKKTGAIGVCRRCGKGDYGEEGWKDSSTLKRLMEK